jgi:hypothetical protein
MLSVILMHISCAYYEEDRANEDAKQRRHGEDHTGR